MNEIVSALPVTEADRMSRALYDVFPVQRGHPTAKGGRKVGEIRD